MKVITILTLIAIIATASMISTLIMQQANAIRHSENTCGLDGQSFQATSNGRVLGEGTSSAAHIFKSQGSSLGKDVSSLAKQSC
ncbi:MAG: hypothetical protein ACTHJ7_09170 [Candidatus Nitrosocosmicus sp.]